MAILITITATSYALHLFHQDIYRSFLSLLIKSFFYRKKGEKKEPHYAVLP